jgi:hypothetical protein
VSFATGDNLPPAANLPPLSLTMVSTTPAVMMANLPPLLLLFSEAWEKMIQEKNLKQKIS